MNKLIFKKVVDLPDLPRDWSIVRVSMDWNAQPLVLIAEGRPPRPEPPVTPQAWHQWLTTQPRAHHLIFMESGSAQHVRFDDATQLSTYHVQPIEGGWLLGGRRSAAGLYSHSGKRLGELDLGDASEDLQTTIDGTIWVSYFDEGVFGGTIAGQGLVAFNLDGTPLFRFADVAEQSGLPFIADCYAMNVEPISGEVWINYYTDFPLVQVAGGAVKQTFMEFGSLGNDFSICDDGVLYAKNGELVWRGFGSVTDTHAIDARDEDGAKLVPISAPHLGFIGRGSDMLLNTGRAIYSSSCSDLKISV